MEKGLLGSEFRHFTEEIREMLRTEEFSSRSQTVAYFFAGGFTPSGLYKEDDTL